MRISGFVPPHSHPVGELTLPGADGGYIRSSGGVWVRAQGLAPADLTGPITAAQLPLSAVRVVDSNHTTVTISTINEQVMHSMTIPGGALGANGWARLCTWGRTTGTASLRSVRVRYSGLGGTLVWARQVNSPNAFISFVIEVWLWNLGATNSNRVAARGHTQIPAATLEFGNTAILAVDTTVDTTLVVTGEIGAGPGDTVVAEFTNLEILRLT